MSQLTITRDISRDNHVYIIDSALTNKSSCFLALYKYPLPFF